MALGPKTWKALGEDGQLIHKASNVKRVMQPGLVPLQLRGAVWVARQQCLPEKVLFFLLPMEVSLQGTLLLFASGKPLLCPVQ